MDYTMIGESIKSATSIRLGDIFKVASIKDGKTVYTYPYRYKENITSQKYPNFNIVQVNTNVTPRQTLVESVLNNDRKRIQLDYLMNIQYRVAQNTETITNLRQQLEAVGLRLLSEFDYITLDLPVWVKNARYEIVDGVLQFFFNITVYATLDAQNDPEMEELHIDEILIDKELTTNEDNEESSDEDENLEEGEE